jgi:hypothetical protein
MGEEGSIFWKTRDIGLSSYSNNLSTAKIFKVAAPFRSVGDDSSYAEINYFLKTGYKSGRFWSDSNVLYIYYSVL